MEARDGAEPIVSLTLYISSTKALYVTYFMRHSSQISLSLSIRDSLILITEMFLTSSSYLRISSQYTKHHLRALMHCILCLWLQFSHFAKEIHFHTGVIM